MANVNTAKASEMVFKVIWEKLFKSLAVNFLCMIVIPILFFLVIRLIKLDFDFAEVFRHITFFGACIGIFAIIAVSIFFALCLALYLKGASVILGNEYIEGMGYLTGMKKKIPLKEINRISSINTYGINGFIVSSEKHGGVIIYRETERFDDLMLILNSYLSQEA